MYLFINFKAYKESTSSSASLLISRMEEKFGNDERIKIVLNPLDSLINSNFDKYIQHADPIPQGAYTGFLPIELLPQYNYKGLMINHSEHRVDEDVIKNSINESKRVGLKIILCAKDIGEIESFSRYEPDFLAYEPPELIGGNISVSESKPEIIKEAYELLKGKGVKLIVGAGIKTGKDVKRSLELGAEGVLVASGIVKSKEPIKVIQNMLDI